MFDKEKFTPEFYDKLSESEKKELIRVMLEDQLTDGLHIKGLPKPVQNSIKSAAKLSAKNMKEETMAGYPVEWINGIKSKDEIRNSEIDVLTGCTQNFKLQQKIDMLEAYEDDIRKFLGIAQYRTIPISDRAVIYPPYRDEMIKSVKRLPIHTYDWPVAPSHRADRMGRIWLDSMPKLCEHVGISKDDYLAWLYASTRKRGYQPNTLYIRPRAFGHNYKSSLWMKLMDVQSYSIDNFPMLPEPITTVQLYDVIHWNPVHINYTFGLKAKDCRARYALEELVGYNDLSPISRMIFDSLKVNGPEMLKQGKLVGPNFNEDKECLERFIKRRKKK